MYNNLPTHIDYCKYLGLILDSKMSRVQHIFSAIYVMYQARKYLDKKG